MDSQTKKVLVLGAGFVSPTLVEYLHREKHIAITVCSAIKDEADLIAQKYPGVDSVYLNVLEKSSTLQELMAKSDVVVSLLPYHLHAHVAKCCIDTKTHLVTASYVQQDVKALHDQAVAAGITILNEVGLDPGIDHLLALECIHDIQNTGGKVSSFVSYCGGLPAPEYSDNPLRYKFSWSPRGALISTLSSAKYLSKGQVMI